MKIVYLLPLFLAIACGKSKEPSSTDAELVAKKKELSLAREELKGIKSSIANLERDIQKIDPSVIKNNITLVSASVVEKKPFEHKIEVRGNVQSRKNIQISSQVSGAVEHVYVQEGQHVKRDQILLSINADVLKNTISEHTTALELATSIFKKQKELWSQQVGTEVQYLQAKNSKESLERRLATARSQLKQNLISAPFAGAIEHVQIKEGEFATPGTPLVKITSPKDMYLQADISEKYLGRFSVGSDVNVSFPSQDKKAVSVILAIGQIINKQNRTFEIEVKMPDVDFPISPNQVVILWLRDYYNKQSWVVPTRIIQQDNKGQFIFYIKSEERRLIAKKLAIEIGASYNRETEVIKGLTSQEQVIFEGFRDLADGNEVNIVTNETQ